MNFIDAMQEPGKTVLLLIITFLLASASVWIPLIMRRNHE